jgi:hypothetical protein
LFDSILDIRRRFTQVRWSILLIFLIKLIPLAQRRNSDFENDLTITCGTMQRQRDPYCQTASAMEDRRGRKIWSRREAWAVPRLEAVAYFLNASKSRSPVCARCRIRAAIACRRLSSRGPMSEQARSSTAVKKVKSLDSKKDTNIVDSLSNRRHLGFVAAREWGTFARCKIDH